MESGPLDAVNTQIIEQLRRDGRTSYAALAKIVGLSEAAVRQRMQWMLGQGIMQVVAVTDPLRLGFARQVMIGLRVHGDLEAAAQELAALPEVDHVVACAGSYDLLIELACHDDEHLYRILNTDIRAVPGVTETETFVYLRLIKQTYTRGAR